MVSESDDEVLGTDVQVRACLDVISSCLAAEFGPDVADLSLSWSLPHGKYKIIRPGPLADPGEEAAYYTKRGSDGG